MNNQQKGVILVIIDVIVIAILVFFAIWSLVKGYPNTLGSIIDAF